MTEAKPKKESSVLKIENQEREHENSQTAISNFSPKHIAEDPTNRPKREYDPYSLSERLKLRIVNYQQ